MKLLAILPLLLLGAANPPIPPNAPPNSSYVSDAWPPDQYTKDTAAIVIFASNVEMYCGKAGKGLVIIACDTQTKDGTQVIVLPNPNGIACDDWYARIAAHEMAHANGWPAYHGGESERCPS